MDDETSADESKPDEAQLEELGGRISAARGQAEDVIQGFEEPEEEYVESGDEEAQAEDDQSIAPPG